MVRFMSNMGKLTHIRALTRVGLVALMLVVGSMHITNAQSGPVQTLAAGNAAFALSLYQWAQANESGNLLYSPYSISQALAMTYAGARSTTEAQMRQVLNFSLRGDELHRTFLLVNGELTLRGNAPASEARQASTLRIANRLWGEQTYQFRDAFLALVTANYGAGLQPLDFVGATEQARGQINDWVAEQTNDRIKDIIPQNALSPDTRLVLTNAVYFKQAWLNQFQPEATTDGPFTLLDGTTVTAPMMFQSNLMGYAKGAGWQALAIPYQSEMSMVVILPDAGQFEAVEKALDLALLQTIVEGVRSRFVMAQLTMPRFTFDYDLKLTEALIALGMTDAFDPAQADFSGMAEVSPQANLFLMGALHKAFIAVDETGTEAAAATAIIAGVTSAPVGELVEFKMDRPFIFAIRDDQTGSLLFIGRVLNPNA
jgi:serpin B